MAAETRVLMVVARFYEDIAAELEAGARAVLEAAGADCESVSVPGALEIPGAIALAHRSGRYAGYVALGCVIRGETSHYEHICTESARGLGIVALDHLAAVGYGILTCEDREQAWARASTDGGNKGREAAEACLAMVAIKRKFGIAGP